MDLPISYLTSSIERGSIFHSTRFKEIGHGKFFVIVGVSEEEVAGFFFINSNINKSLFHKQEQFALQYLLRKNDYSFLRYDSFLCASSLLKLSVRELAKELDDGVAKIIGTIKEVHMNEILESVRASSIYTNADKKKFFYE